MSEPENWTVDHREYKDLPKELLNLEAPGLETFSYTHKTKYGQQVDVFVADARPDGKGDTSISSTTYNYRIDRSLMVSNAVDALVTGTRQAVAGLPGVRWDLNDPLHTHGAFQTPWQSFSGLVRADTEPTAAVQVEALIAALDLQKGEKIRIRGESQGVDQAVGFITSMTSGKFAGMQLQITNVDFDEIIHGYGKHSFPELLRTAAGLTNFEASLLQQYIDENGEIGFGSIVPFDKESSWHEMVDKRIKKLQRFAVISSGAAVRKGIDIPLVRAIQNGSSGGGDTEYTLTRAINSKVSQANDIALLAEALKRVGASVRLATLVPGENDFTPDGKPKLLGHAFSRSIGRKAARADWSQRKAA